MATNRIQLQANTGARRIPAATKAVWTGRVISGLVILFLLVDAIPKLLKMDFAVDATVELGYSDSTVAWIGLTLLLCTVLYSIPRTAILGMVLLTGFLGGAVATQVRIESANFLFPLVFGALAWIGLYLRNEKVRDIFS